MLDETEFLSDYGIRAISKHHDRHPYVFNVNGIGLERALFAGGIRFGLVRRQFQLARPDLVSRQLPADRIAAEVPSLLRRRFQDRVPDRFGEIRHHRRRGARNRRALDAEFSSRTSTAGAPSSAQSSTPADTTRIFAITCCSTNIFTATPAAAWAPRTRPAGPAWSPSCCSPANARELNDQPTRRRFMEISMHPAHLPRPVMPRCPPQRMLQGQKALVTGASSGIGRAIALALGQAGADVVVNYVAGEDKARAGLARRFAPSACGRCRSSADVSDEDQVQWTCSSG